MFLITKPIKINRSLKPDNKLTSTSTSTRTSLDFWRENIFKHLWGDFVLHLKKRGDFVLHSAAVTMYNVNLCLKDRF